MMKGRREQLHFSKNKHLQMVIKALRFFHHLAENSLQFYLSIRGAKNNVLC